MPDKLSHLVVVGVCCWFVMSVADTTTSAQEAAKAAVPAQAAVARPVTVGPDGKPRPAPAGATGQPGQPGEAVAPGKKLEDAKDEANPVVTRSTKPPLPPDPRELQVEPNPDGKVRFNFHGQSWAHVLEWLARVSAMSLDWQELPGDYLNLVTQREYTIPEARDLINRHLLARGFTLLEQGEILSVANIQKLNAGMVPRIEASELSKHMPHEYVKVSFSLDWLLSEKAVEELKPMLSPNAKITALKNTNRVEAMDAVVNLLEVYTVIQREQSHSGGGKLLVQEFPLRHTRAADVITQLQALLGMETQSANARPKSPQEAQMAQQQAMMMMQMQRQQGGPPVPPQPKKGEDINLVANPRRNSILANAPPDKMEIIAQAVLAIDVESDRTQSLLANVNRMQVYRLHAIDPDSLVRTLLEIGEMDPVTRLDVDTKNKAIIAYASMADHMTIRKVVERLDGSTRQFEVIHLRRLEADYVAGTVEFMMSGPKEQKPQSRYYDYYYSPYRSNTNTEESQDKFRVDADVENNRLLLWANEVEIGEVRNLLVKLGEIPAENGRGERIRMLDSLPPAELEQLLQRLRQAWPSLAPNPLQLPSPATKRIEPEASPTQKGVLKEARRIQPATADDATLVALWHAPEDAAEDDSSRAPDEARDDRPAEPPIAEFVPRSDGSRFGENAARGGIPPLPPVELSVTPDGRLLISSQDTKALDLLEEFIGQVAPARRDYRIFKLRYGSAYWVSTYLNKFFETDSEEKKNSTSRYIYYYDPPAAKDEPSYRLSKRRKLKFIDDIDTNSILVQGADAGQLKTIEDLIAIYDTPQQADSNAARLTTVFAIKYSKAELIADAVKDVYRDLLSSNDKALQSANANPEQKNRPTAATTYIFNEGGDTSSDKERTRVSFKGKLSIGVDDVSNTLLVSTEGEVLMRNVTEMVHALDNAAKPLSTVSVLKLGNGTSSSEIRDVLNRVLTEPKVAPKNGTGPQQPQRPGQPNQAGGEAGVVGAVQ